MPIVPGSHLLAIWLATVLALSVPVIGWCSAAEAQGQAFHAIFAHVHHVDTPAEHLAMDHEAAPEHSHGEHGTSWSASSVFGSSGLMDGLQILAPLSATIGTATADVRLVLASSRPASHIPAPVFPPPRRDR